MNNTYDTVNEKSKAIFPGYEQKLTADKAKKLQRNALLPFLMVRAGVYNLLIVPLLGAGIFAAAAKPIPASLSYPQQELGGLIGLTMIGVGTILTIIASASNKDTCKRIMNTLSNYAQTGEYSINKIDSAVFSRALKLIPKYMAKNDARLFNNMLKNPESINNIDVATSIVSGHLKSHPEDATQISSVFDITTMPKKLQKQINQIMGIHSK
jgi:hypothetical protein